MRFFDKILGRKPKKEEGGVVIEEDELEEDDMRAKGGPVLQFKDGSPVTEFKVEGTEGDFYISKVAGLNPGDIGTDTLRHWTGVTKNSFKTKAEARSTLVKMLKAMYKAQPGYNKEMKKGGSIPNNYEGKTPEQVWNELTPIQREHFLQDHQESTWEHPVTQFAGHSYSNLPKIIQSSFNFHVSEGQYASGGGIGGFFDKVKGIAHKGIEGAKSKIHDRNKKIAIGVLDETRGKVVSRKDARVVHIAADIVEDQYAKGGKVKKLHYLKKDLSKAMVFKMAKEFAAQIQKYIGKKKLEKVVELNKAEKDKSICHSHDFCDPNQAMIDVWEKHGLDVGNMSQRTIKNINKIWDLAKKNNFYVK